VAAQDYRFDDVPGIIDVDVANAMAKMELTDRGMFSIEIKIIDNLNNNIFIAINTVKNRIE